MEKWRLIETPPLEGALNMAIDSVLFQKVLEGKSAPFLRLYSWKNPTISLGHFQKAKEFSTNLKASQKKVPLVRRITGGRAVYHHEELTYSLAAFSNSRPWCARREPSYRAISHALIAALKPYNAHIGFSRAQPSSRELSGGIDCFAASSKYEVEQVGRKLVGSAQRRHKNGFLQHGSIMLLKEASMFLSSSETKGPSLTPHSISLEEIVGRQISPKELAQNFPERFFGHLQIGFEKKELSQNEMEEAKGRLADFQLGL